MFQKPPKVIGPQGTPFVLKKPKSSPMTPDPNPSECSPRTPKCPPLTQYPVGLPMDSFILWFLFTQKNHPESLCHSLYKFGEEEKLGFSRIPSSQVLCIDECALAMEQLVVGLLKAVHLSLGYPSIHSLCISHPHHAHNICPHYCWLGSSLSVLLAALGINLFG